MAWISAVNMDALSATTEVPPWNGQYKNTGGGA